MFGLRRFRFRSPERNRETDERRLKRIKAAVHSSVLEAEAELKGLRLRVARTRRSVMSLLAQINEREPDPACRAELTNLERTLLAGERSHAQLEDHLTVLRKLERRLDRLIDQPRVSAVAAPQFGPPERPDT
jgi:hypothetical protein